MNVIQNGIPTVTEHILSTPRPRDAGLQAPATTERTGSPLRSKLSINETTTYRWSLLDDISAYRDAGISAIGIWRPKLSEFGEERGIELVQDSGLEVSSLSWAGGFTGSHGHTYTEAIDDAREAIHVASRLNARSLVIVSGARAGHTLNHAQRMLVDALKALADDAAERQIRLALQPMHRMFSQEWSFLTSLDSTLDVLAACDHPSLGIAFDVYHLWQEPRLLERIEQIAPHVATLRLNDWREPPRSDVDRCLPGEGEIPLREITHTFLESGYDGYFEIDIWSEELWCSDYVELLGRCQRGFDALCPY